MMGPGTPESTTDPDIGVVVVTHGQLATELVNAAEMIVGAQPKLVAVSIRWHDDVEAARAQLVQAVDRVKSPGGVLVLTDMFGGTPANLAMTLLGDDQVEVITGVNLPMLIKLASARRGAGLSEVARLVRDQGQTAIWVVSDLVRARADD